LGKLITFWSPVCGQAKVTSTMCAIVSALGLWHPKLEIAIAHTGEGNMNLEDGMDMKIEVRRKKDFYERTGLSALILNYKQGDLSSEKIRRCAVPLLLGNVVLFPGLGEEFLLVQGGDLTELRFHILTEKVTKEFEMTCLDLQNGWSEISFRYMQAADLNVIVLPQVPQVWELYLKEYQEKLEGKNVYFVFGGYAKSSRYGNWQLKRSIRRAGEHVGSVPWNVGFMDAMSEGRIMEFFMRNRVTIKREENYEFMEQTKRTAEKVRKLVGSC